MADSASLAEVGNLVTVYHGMCIQQAYDFHIQSAGAVSDLAAPFEVLPPDMR
jgi:hypothetical protein